jgi:hypothetical protein
MLWVDVLVLNFINVVLRGFSDALHISKKNLNYLIRNVYPIDNWLQLQQFALQFREWSESSWIEEESWGNGMDKAVTREERKASNEKCANFFPYVIEL